MTTPNVSISLQNNEDARPIIEAILADNPEATIAHYPSMVKIDAPGRLRVNADSVSERMGRDWDPQEIELSMITMNGNINEEYEYFELYWNQPQQA